MTQNSTITTLTPEPWAKGLYFGESPRWHAASNTLYVSDMIGRKIYTIDNAGETSVLLEEENQPNGMAFMDNNTLITSSMFDAKLYRYQLDTKKTELYADLSAVMTGYCGDMVIDHKGRVFIDDTGARVLHGETPRPGRLLMVEPDTKKVSSVAENIVFPNGIGIDSTGKNLYLAATFTYHLYKFSLDADTGALNNQETIWDAHELATVANKEHTRFCGIDGICIDAQDCMWLSMLGYQMFIRRDKNGAITHQIHVDGDATACALGGSDGKTLFLVVNKVPKGEDLFDAMVGKRTKCSIMTVRVDVGAATGV
ncbi:calcium-dependent phosphotriesterase [Microthyrium microscopicum]|uniref:Calcium-dependent phosphotriesterase n=1 Tax=Microthyrium microscopicum TaxID=703497 RepID=A0A6A6UJ78_9PEZI|nr:calcium-dependent phosphotriesterase [Microthyrium microscopicum]